MIRPIRTFIDANVFVATWTLDVLLTLADRGLLNPCWSEAVLNEARKAVNQIHGTKRGVHYIAAAESAFPYALVNPDESDLLKVEFPDPNDRHVIAAAIAGNCEIIVTYNVKDFPPSALSPMGLRALRPDDFLMEVASESPKETIAAVNSIVAVKKRPPRTMDEELKGLRANRLDGFANFIEQALELG